jgi:methylation protein EvaC
MKSETLVKRIKCASCNDDNFNVIHNFGDVPLAGSFPLEADRDEIKQYPLSIMMCNSCKLIQTDTLIEPKVLFKDYRYISSVGMQNHFNLYADWLVSKELIKPTTNILEFGCNDGPLLDALRHRGIHRTIGIDPATNIVELGKKKGLNIINDFFNSEFVESNRWEDKFDYVLASNTFAHITDINSVVKGIEQTLKKNGKFIFEVQYLVDLVDKFQFDFMYHEHLYYYTVTSLSHLLSKHGLKIIDVERVPIHGGSIRVIATKDLNVEANNIVEELIENEKEYEDLSNFSLSVEKALSNLKEFLDNNKNKKIIGYGASGRANVVIGTLNLNSKDVAYIIDESPERYNRFTSNGNIPIYAPDKIDSDVDFILIFAWNFADMIIEKTKHLGIPYVIPFPKIKIINEK